MVAAYAPSDNRKDMPASALAAVREQLAFVDQSIYESAKKLAMFAQIIENHVIKPYGYLPPVLDVELTERVKKIRGYDSGKRALWNRIPQYAVPYKQHPHESVATPCVATESPTYKQSDQVAEPQSDLEVRHDPNLSRQVIKLHQVMSYRIWLIMRDKRRRMESGAQWWLYVDMLDLLAEYGLQCGRTALDTAISNDLFFRRSGDRVYFKGVADVAGRLQQRLHAEKLPDTAKADKPGETLYFITIGGPLSSFESRCYAHWLASRRYAMLARKTLETAWNRTRQSLRKWEKREHIRRYKNFGQTGELRDERIPAEHAEYIEVTDSDGELHGRYTWRRPNLYVVPETTRLQRHVRGQGRKVREVVNAVLSELDSPLINGEGVPSHVRNWQQHQTAKGTQQSWNRYDKELRKNPDRRYTMDYVQLKSRRWELMPIFLDNPRTHTITGGQYFRVSA